MAPQDGLRIETVVIGAGITGLSTALFLARAGREVMVLDRGDPWGESSGGNAGTLSLQVKHPLVLDLMQLSLDLWEAEAGSRDLGYERTGGVRVALSQDEVVMLKKSVALQQRHGYGFDYLEGKALHRAVPWLGPGVLAASLSPRDAFSSPLRCGPQLLRAVSEAGVDIVDHREVQAIEPDGGYRLVTPAGAIRCDIVVIAAGVWSGHISAMLGVELPLMVDVNMLTITEPVDHVLDRVVTHIGGVLSLKQYPNGTCMIGGGWQGKGNPESGTKELDYEQLLHNLRIAARVVPGLRQLRILRSWSGFESVAPDALPVLGRLPGREGVFIATGARGGYSLGPAQGMLLSEMIARDHTTLPADPFDPARLVS